MVFVLRVKKLYGVLPLMSFKTYIFARGPQVELVSAVRHEVLAVEENGAQPLPLVISVE